MKKLFLLAFICIGMQTLLAQSLVEKWKPFSEYHELLSKTFHPSEEGNFGPIKEFSQELNSKAEALNVATLPQEYRNPKVESNLVILKKQTKLVNDLVKNKAPNAEIMRAFEDLHDIFHRIILLCNDLKNNK
jgi:hypothetical protein